MSPRPDPTAYPDQAKALAEELDRRTHAEVRFDRGSRALYATDGSNYRQVPIGVVVPRRVEDVVATLAACREHGAPVLSRGGGTSLAGQCCNTAVVIDFSKYLNRILDIDVDNRIATVEPGVILDHLRDATEAHHLTFGPDPATHDHNCLGGMLGNNSCGIRSVMAGRTADNTEALEILTYDGLRMWVGRTSEEELESIIAEGGRRGEIYRRLRDLRDRYADLIRARYPKIPRRVSGYNLDELLPENGFNVARALVGSEGTCVAILQAKLNLVHSPPHRVLLVLGYPDVYQAGDHVPEIMAHGPTGCEGIDQLLIDFLHRKEMRKQQARLLPEGKGWLLVELGGETEEEAVEKARRAMEDLGKGANPPSMTLYADKTEQHELWLIRESGLAATAWVPGMAATWPGWEDSAVPPAKVGAYLRDFRRKLDEFGYGCSLYGHFGDGCIHVRIDFDLRSREGIAKYRRFLDEMADVVLAYGGSFSGEHGDGQSRAELLPKMYGPELMEAMREFKRIWDPDWKMNPGKVVDPRPIDADLRLGPEFKPEERGWSREAAGINFALEQDGGDFIRSAMRCVGVGKCRHTHGEVMCPSFMATREEKHSTRGRARLLFEMVHGGTITDGWKSREVHEALDLCLACKGCKRDCPVNVDMATYKAEFHAHYYQHHPRPRTAWSMGMIYWWSRLAAEMPGAVNMAMRTPGVADAIKRAAGIHPKRRLPRYAARSFKKQMRGRRPRNADGRPVALFADTFSNYFHTGVALAGLEVLEAAGCRVEVPTADFCCGRPLYAWGMLDRARENLRGVMEQFGRNAAEGVPIVGLEPACITTLRDELPSLFPNDERARRIAENSFMLPEFLAGHDWRPPRLERKALVQPHCYEHAVIGMDSETELMGRIGLAAEILDGGCCGMAGSFGFEEDHYEVSVKCGERVLLPAVREAGRDTLILANGFACREQIAQGSERRALHLAEVLQMVLHQKKQEGP